MNEEQLEQQVLLAKLIATEAHMGQTRWDKTVPYITHPAEVAKRCKNLGYDGHVIATAWLHDVVEDCDISLLDLQKRGVHSTIISAVDAITKRKDQSEGYLAYIKRVRNNPLATIVKCEDLRHNMSDLKPGSMYQKYELALYILEHSL